MNMDKKLVAAKEGNGREVGYISRKFHLAVGIVLGVMLAIGKNGKHARSRKRIYAAIKNQNEPE